MKFSPRTPSSHKRIATRTSPAMVGLLLVALLARWAFGQTASVYGPSGGYMGRIVVASPVIPGTLPEATAAGISADNVRCPKELPKDQYRKCMPAGIEPAPGLGICDGRVEK